MPKTICSKNKLLLVCMLILLSINYNTVTAEEIAASSIDEQPKQENINTTSSISINSADKQKYDKICKKANSLVDKKEYDKASIMLEQAFAISKELDMANAILSKIFLCQNLNDGNAMFYAQKALSYNPENYIANYVIGKVYSNQNDFEKALTYFNNSILAKPTFHEPLLDIGIVYCNKKDYNKSVDYLTKYLSTNPDKENLKKAYFWRMKAYLYGKISLDNAMSDANALIKFDNKNPEYYSYKGRIYSEMANHRKEALQFADKSVKMAKKDKSFGIYANKIYVYSEVSPIAVGILSDIDTAIMLAGKDENKLIELCEILDGYNNQYYKNFKRYSNGLLGKLVEVSQKTLEIAPDNKKALTINLKAKAEFEKLKISQNKANLPPLRQISNTTKPVTGPIVFATNNTKPVNTNPTPVIAQRSIPKTAPTPSSGGSGFGTGTGVGTRRTTGGQYKNGRPGIDSTPNKLPTPSWIDTQNPIGPKVYLDANSQYYYGWGAVYTVKYLKDGKPMYTQIELKGLRGNRAAILSVDRNFKSVYNIPITRNYKNITPDQAIYNSTKMVLNNTKKQTCPDSICKVGYGNQVSESETGIGAYNDAIKEPDFGPYMRELQRRIKMNWDPPRGNESKQVVLLFKIAKDGRLLSCSVFKSSGNSDTDKAAIRAVAETAPFRPLPSEYKEQSIDIQFTFDYNVFRN